MKATGKSSNKFKFKRKRELVLTEKQRKEIWGEEGPYSEAYLTFETRIIDDEISKIILKVEVSINPLTFELINQNKDVFLDDRRIQAILEYAEFTNDLRGYEACLFSVPYKSDMLKIANDVLKETEEAIIKMHKFVMNYYDINTN